MSKFEPIPAMRIEYPGLEFTASVSDHLETLMLRQGSHDMIVLDRKDVQFLYNWLGAALGKETVKP